MPAKRRAKSSISALHIVVVVGLLVCVAIGLAILLAPEKPPPPPDSEISYEARPDSDMLDGDVDTGTWRTTRRSGRNAETNAAVASNSNADPAEDAAYLIQGTVVDDESGAALPDVRLTAQRIWSAGEEADWQRRNREASTEAKTALEAERKRLQATMRGATDAAGSFSLPIAVAGHYRIDARVKGYQGISVDTPLIDDEAPLAELRIALSTGAQVSGRVTEEGSSRGAPGLRVYIENQPSDFGITDEQGRYEISGLRVGDFAVTIDLAQTEYRVGTTIPFERISISDPKQKLQVDFSVEAAGVVWGYVMTPGKEPVPNSEIVLTTSESVLTQALTAMVKQAPPIRARADDTGYYELLGIPLNQEWRVYASSEAHSPQLGDPFLLTSQSRSVRIDVFLMGGTLVTGRVVDDSGNPIPDAQVLCIPSYGQLVRAVDVPQAFRDSNSDADGFFEIAELPAGSYQVIARKKGFKFRTSGIPIYPDGYDDINGLRVELQPVDAGEHAIFGVVTDASGQGIASADVSVRGMGGESLERIELATSTDGSGMFRIEGVEIGMYSLEVVKEGYGRRSVPRAVVDDEMRIVLQPSALLAGRVLVRETEQPSGLPFTISASNLSRSGGISLASMRNTEYQGIPFESEDGSFQLSLPAGDWQIEGRTTGYTPGRTSTTLLAGDTVDDVIIYISTAGGTIAGRVRAMDGGSVAGATVSVIDSLSMGDSEREQRVGEDGVFSFDQLPEGNYNVIAQHVNYANASTGTFYLAAEESREDLDLRLGAGGVLEGTVYHNGSPVEGALLLIASIDSATSTTATTDASGKYYAEGLAGGMYEVTVTQISGGALGGSFEWQGGSVEIIEGQVTRKDFGIGGTTVNGTCIPAPPPPIPGAVFLRAPGPPIMQPGEVFTLEDLSRASSYYRGSVSFTGRFQLEGVTPGIYQIEVYYVGGIDFEVQNVYFGTLEVPSTPTIEVPISVQMY